MNRQLLLFILLLIFMNCFAQKNKLEKVILEFKHFKYYDTEYIIDFNKNELECHMSVADKTNTLFSNKYSFNEKISEKLVYELNKTIPDSITTRGENGLDGGRFIITYLKRMDK